MVIAILVAPAAPAAGQSEARETETHPAISTASHPASAFRLYMGMWSSHVRGSVGRFEGNGLLGIAARGFYGATFINSFGSRAFAGGIQRGLAGGGEGHFVPSLSYRFGLVTGYDDEFMRGASRVPALPFGQLVGTVDLPRVGAELAYAGLVTSLIVSWRF